MPTFVIPWMLLAALWSVGPAQADNANSNRQILPLGESQSFLGNAGVARSEDTGAVYYNPAGLADLKSGRISVTGSVYLSFNTKTDAILYLDNTNVGYQASGFNTIPAFYVAAYQLGEWFGALSVVVPNSVQIENWMPFSTPNTGSNVIQSSRSSDLWLGLSAAHKLSEQWGLGMTVFGDLHEEANTMGLDMGFPAAPTAAALDTIQQVNLKVFGLSAVLGVTYKTTDWLRLGFRAQTALLQLSGSASTLSITRQFSSGTIKTTGESRATTPANFQLPFDFSLGTALIPTDWFAFMADLSLQLGAAYNSIPDSNLGEKVNLVPTPRFNLGMEFKPWQWMPVRLGFYYNPSANGGTAGTEGLAQENFCGFTFGLGFNSTRVQTGVGFFYLWSTGQTTPFGAPNTTAAVSSRGTGALLTTSYLL